MHCGHAWCRAADDARRAVEAAELRHAATMAQLIPERGFMPPLYWDEYTAYERAVLQSRGFQLPTRMAPKAAPVGPHADQRRTRHVLTMADAGRTAA